MDSTTVKRILVVLAIVAIVILAITGIVRLATGGGDDTGGDSQTLAAETSLLDYDNSTSSVSLTYEGAIVGREDYREIRYSVSPTRRRIEVVQGYNGTVLRRETYRNDAAAYAVFLRALNFEGFAEVQENELGDDHRGVCPTGNRTIVQLFDDGQRQLKLWSASCDDKVGTLAGNERRLRRLFEVQIPDFRELTRGVRL